MVNPDKAKKTEKMLIQYENVNENALINVRVRSV